MFDNLFELPFEWLFRLFMSRGKTKSFLFFVISLFCATSCFAFSRAIDRGVPYNGSTEDTIYLGDIYSAKSIIVDKGCATWFYDIKSDSISEKSSPSQLYADVFGAEPLSDSTKTYEQWEKNCEQVADSTERSFPNLKLALISLGLSGVGGYLTFYPYEGKVTRGFGMFFGICLLVDGLYFLGISFVGAVRGDVEKRAKMQRDLAEEYGKQKRRWELKINPLIDPQNSGGGLLMLLTF